MKAIAVALLLNGVQINMPAPALILDGRAWVPLKPVARRLGWTVQVAGAWAVVSRDDQHLRTNDCRLIHGHVYVPARWLKNLGAQVSWDPATRTVNLLAALPPSSEAPVTIAKLMSDPAAWAGRMVSLVGEFLGFYANPLWDALRFGPPVTTGDWVIRGEGGCLYCVGKQPFDFPAQLGRRLRVSGTVELTDRGCPFIRVASAQPLSGRDALCCCILTDAHRYRAGSPIKLRLLVRNDSAEPIELTFPTSQVYDFRLLDSEGRKVWQWSDGKAFLMAITRRAFQPGQQQTIEETLDPADLADRLTPGVYYAEGELRRNARSYREKLVIEGD